MENFLLQEIFSEDYLEYLHSFFDTGMKFNFFIGILSGLFISLFIFMTYQLVDLYKVRKQARKELKNKEKEV